MFIFTAVEFSDVVQVHLLSLDTAHLFPYTERLIYQLLVQGVGASQQKLLCQFVSLNEEAPRLHAVIQRGGSPGLVEPPESLVDVFSPLDSCNFLLKLIEVVA